MNKLIFSCLIALPIVACQDSSEHQVPKIDHKEKPATEASVVEIKKTGEASWYGPGFEGNKTANGETFKSDAMTAASPDLPLGSKAEVTNLDTGKKAQVRINDRGPHVKQRVLDVSPKAAKKLGMTRQGKARVKIVAKHKKKPAPKKENYPSK